MSLANVNTSNGGRIVVFGTMILTAVFQKWPTIVAWKKCTNAEESLLQMTVVPHLINAKKGKATVTSIRSVALDLSVEKTIVTIPWGLNWDMIAVINHDDITVHFPPYYLINFIL